MIDIDLRRYGTDKEYEKFVNGLISGADIDEEPEVIKMDEPRPYVITKVSEDGEE